MNDGESYEEWLDDFSASTWSEGEVEELLVQSRKLENPRFRQLVKSFQGQRWLISALLTRIDSIDPNTSQDDPILKMARTSISWKQ